jgi:hypothetical protein
MRCGRGSRNGPLWSSFYTQTKQKRTCCSKCEATRAAGRGAGFGCGGGGSGARLREGGGRKLERAAAMAHVHLSSVVNPANTLALREFMLRIEEPCLSFLAL